ETDQHRPWSGAAQNFEGGRSCARRHGWRGGNCVDGPQTLKWNVPRVCLIFDSW
ncbi:unnamed protein product, partial [Pylaiella littoralis]